MPDRRDFLKSVATIGAAGAVGTPAMPNGSDDRSCWLRALQRIAAPLLGNLSRRELKKAMPIEANHPTVRAKYAHLEAFGRLVAGIAPWLAAQGLGAAEANLQQDFVHQIHASLDAATDPTSPDFMNFDKGDQPLVDTAFLAQGILRGRSVLWESLAPRIRTQVIQAMKSSRAIGTPKGNNWVMFAATVEAVLQTMGEKTVEERLEGCVLRMLGWYAGDGVYGDGEWFHFDYYNSFVIHPMLLDVLAVLKQKDSQFEAVYATELQRAKRYGEIQERLIAPDGTFPAIGRSITYRFGALHALAQIALIGELSESIKPAQVRCGMTAVIRKMIEAPGTFDDRGWLRIGFYGHQPSLAEDYISTGSLYLCSVALLPLGLPPSNPFWSMPPARWTSQLIWSGDRCLRPDHAISDTK